MALSVIEQKKAHAAVWRRVHADPSIRNFDELAEAFHQPREWVMDALGRDVPRVSKLLKVRRGTPRVRHEWRKERAWSQIRKTQIQGRDPSDHYGQHRTVYADAELPEGF